VRLCSGRLCTALVVSARLWSSLHGSSDYFTGQY
jgi:hypothetical protein